MSGKVVNLNRARKAREKDAQTTRAQENVARFGRTKAEKAIEAAQADKARRTLDDHERE